MSDPHTPSITDASAPSATTQTISLQDLGMKYLGGLQRIFDTAAFVVEGTRQVTERTYDESSTAVRFMPAQGNHRRFDDAKVEAERWLLKNLLQDALGLVVPFLEDVRSVAALARWKAANTGDNAALQRILTEERRAFLALNLGEKFTHLQHHFSIASPLAPQVEALAKIGGCLAARGGVVSERDVTQGGELAVTLVSLQLVPTRAAAEQSASGGSGASITPQIGELRRAFSVGETIRFEKPDYLNVITTISLFVSSILKGLQEDVVKIQGAKGGA